MKKYLVFIPLLILMLFLGIGAADTRAAVVNNNYESYVLYYNHEIYVFDNRNKNSAHLIITDLELLYGTHSFEPNSWQNDYDSDILNRVQLSTIFNLSNNDSLLLYEYYTVYHVFGGSNVPPLPLTGSVVISYNNSVVSYYKSGSTILTYYNITVNEIIAELNYLIALSSADVDAAYKSGYDAAFEEYAYNDNGTYISGFDAHIKGYNLAKDEYAWVSNGYYYTGSQAYSYGYNAAQGEDLDFLSILTSFLFGIGAVFAIEFIPGVSIGSIALIPIALTLFPKLIGLISGAAVFVEKSAKSASVSSGKKGGKK